MLQAIVMMGSVILVALLGIRDVGGVTEVWNRAVEGGRLFSPMLVLRNIHNRPMIVAKFHFPLFAAFNHEFL